MNRSRQGIVVWLALGCLVIASIGAFMLAGVSQGNLRQLGLLKGETDLRWTSQAVLSSFGNQLKMKPWPRRFYASFSGGYQTSLSYHGKSCTLWAKDSVRAGAVQTGTTDVFVRVADSDLVMGTYQRVRITSAAATTPKVLHVIRELTVREDFQDKAVRDRILKDVEEDEKVEATNVPESDAMARAVDDLAEKDPTPEQALAGARSALGEAQQERKFQELLARGRAMSESSMLAEAITLFSEAVAVATGSSPPQVAQRRAAGQLALSRAQYALGLVSSEPARTDLLTRSTTGLDALVRDLGPGCAGPTAAYLRAQVKMSQSPGRNPAQRTQSREQVGRELASILGTIAPPVTYFEGGSVPAGDLAEQFLATWSTGLAYSDTFIKWIIIPLPPLIFGPPLALPLPIQAKIFLTDDEGKSVVPVTASGLKFPLLWLKDGTALVATDYDSDTGASIVLFDRQGGVLQRYPRIDPTPTNESGGVVLSPAGDQLIVVGKALEEKSRSVWLIDFRGGSPRRLLGPFEGGQEFTVYHDPVAFSHDGRYVAFFDPAEGVKVNEVAAVLPGGLVGPTVWQRGSRLVQPGILWIRAPDGSPRLVIFAGTSDADHPDAKNLVMIDPVTLQSVRSAPFPGDFRPGLVVPPGNGSRLALFDTSVAGALFVDGTTSGFGAWSDLKKIGPFGLRPARGAGNALYFSRGLTQPALYRWDPSSGDPVQLPIQPETGLSDQHGLLALTAY